MKTALICGVSGQDGAYLARLLLEKGYLVHGASRDAQITQFENLTRLGIRDSIETHSMTLTDFRSVLRTLRRVQPDEIYNLSGQSSVGLSFQQPVETFESITLGTINLLEAVDFIDSAPRVYFAGSGESFGDTGDSAATEETSFHPLSPYATAKAAALWAVRNYREAYGVFACTGILFNHESPLRPQRFVTRKIAAAACEIARGKSTELVLGALSVRRDWGWAPEYVEAMHAMLQQENASDFVIATGVSHSLRDFCDAVFAAVELELDDFLRIDKKLYRPLEIKGNRGNPSKANLLLGWRAKTSMQEVATRMVEHEMSGAL